MIYKFSCIRVKTIKCEFCLLVPVTTTETYSCLINSKMIFHAHVVNNFLNMVVNSVGTQECCSSISKIFFVSEHELFFKI